MVPRSPLGQNLVQTPSTASPPSFSGDVAPARDLGKLPGVLREYRYTLFGSIPVLKVHGEPRPAPVVLILHGLGASSDVQRPELVSLAERGLTAVAIDAPHHGARRDGWLEAMQPLGPPESHVRFLRLLREAVPEISRVIEHLTGEGHGPVGLAGISMGAFIALAAAADDPRVAATVSILGSPSWTPRGGPVTSEMSDLMGYAPVHRPADCVRCPLLMLNAGRDTSVPPGLPGGPRDFAYLLAERFPELRARFTYVEYPASDHFMRPEDWDDLWRRTLSFFEANLLREPIREGCGGLR